MSRNQNYNLTRFYAKRYRKQALQHIDKALEYLMRLKLMAEENNHPEIAQQYEMIMKALYEIYLGAQEFFKTQ